MNQKLTTHCYEQQMARLTQQFGGKTFSAERMSLIYREMKNLYNEQFVKLISDFLISARYAPLPKDFIEAAGSKLRENYELEKGKQGAEFSGMFNSEQLASVSKALQKGLRGNDETLKTLIDGLAPLNKAKCKHCNDSGLVYAIARNPEKHCYADYVFNCFCFSSMNDKRFDRWGARFDEHLINKNKRSFKCREL